MVPFIVKHALYPLHEALLRRPTFRQLADLERTQWLSRTDIESLQLQRLAALLRTAAAHSRWRAAPDRAAGVDLRAGLAWGASRRRPTMKRAAAPEDEKRIACLEVRGGATLRSAGGSSGQPASFCFGRRCIGFTAPAGPEVRCSC